jgi:hypothetical protein
MSSVVMIVGNVLGQKPSEMALVQSDDVVEQFTPATAHPAFCQGLWKEVWTAAMFMD